jgi:hypothetical protein
MPFTPSEELSALLCPNRAILTARPGWRQDADDLPPERDGGR